jgi:hypothetical protein
VFDSNAPRGVAWTNEHGSFAIDAAGFGTGCCLAGTADTGRASFSTDSSLFTFSGTRFSHDQSAGSLIGIPGDVRISAVVEPDGTMSGNLIGGVVTAYAGAEGFPSGGIAPGEALLFGTAIDAAAIKMESGLPGPWSVLFLFELTYTHPALSELGGYLTFFGPYQGLNSWGGCCGFEYKPWDQDWGPMSGPIAYDFVRTVKIAEPVTLVLFATAFLGLIARRRCP